MQVSPPERAAASFHGDVLTLPQVVVGYWQHCANDSNLLAQDIRFAREVDRAMRQMALRTRSRGIADTEIDERPLYRSRELPRFRVAVRRLSPGVGALPRDSRGRLLLDVLTSAVHSGPERFGARPAITEWRLAVFAAHRGLLRTLVRLPLAARRMRQDGSG